MREEGFLDQLRETERLFGEAIESFKSHPWVGDVRRWGLMAGVELFQDPEGPTPFGTAERVGARVCVAARSYGVFLRPLGDTLIFVPPLSITPEEICMLVEAASKAIMDVLGEP